MIPALGAALIEGGASLLGSIFGGLSGSSNTRRTNEANLQIARETNQANREQLEAQQAWNEEMWNKQNEYNLPKNQVQRLIEAGINPAVIGANASTPAGAVGSPSSNAMQGATMHAYDPTGAFVSAGQGIANSVDSYFRNRNVESVTHKNEAETAKTRQMTPWEIEQLKNLIRKGGIEADLAKTELAYQTAIQGQKIAQSFGDTMMQQKSMMLMDKEMLQRDLQNKLFDVQLSYAPKLNEAQLNQYYATVNQIKAQIGLISQQSGLTAEQRLTEAARRLGVIIDNGMKGLDFDLKKQTLGVSVDLLREDLYEKQDLRKLRPLDAYQRHLGKAANYTITPGTSQLIGSMIEQDMKRDRFLYYGYGNSQFRPRYQR